MNDPKSGEAKAPEIKTNKDILEYVDVVSILNALQDHVINGKEMTSTQVNAALALLKRALPEEATKQKGSIDLYETVLKNLDSE